MNCKIYASDEGFGPLVRQRAIVAAMQAIKPDLRVRFQTKRLAEAARRILPMVEIVERFNNVSWARKSDGTPDLSKIRAFYADYIFRSDSFIAEETDVEEMDFVISDFCYEAFPAASRFGVPAFGVSHFTWDWFFSKLYPVPVSSEILDRWRVYAESADVLYFPPFTPRDILEAYRAKAREVPFVVAQPSEQPSIAAGARPRVLLMDSGASVLSHSMRKAVAHLEKLKEFQFFVSERYAQACDNITLFRKDELMLNYMPFMDLVVGRAGFNTISECVAHRVPLLLVGEALNPEMEANMLFMKQEGLGSFVSLRAFQESLGDVLRSFFQGELAEIKRRLNSHDHTFDGAEVIARDILERLS